MAVYDVDANRLDEGGSGSSGVSIKSYFKAEMDDTVAKVKAFQTEPCVIFPICTDIHYLSVNETFEAMIDNMRYLSTKVRLDAVACLGDLTDGDVAQATTIKRIDHMFDRFREIGLPIMFAAGNHDANGYYQRPWFTQDQIAQTQYSNNRNDVVFSAGTQNWYWDMPSRKMRFISLCSANTTDNASRYGFPENTDTFVTSALTSTPADYIVVLLVHLSPIASQNWNKTVQINASGVLTAINTWRNADPAHTIISFMGHSHADFAFTSPWLNVAINCQKTEPTITEDYVITQEMVDSGESTGVVGAKHWHNIAETYREDCWDVCVICPNSREVHMIRFGAGEDRDFTY